MSNFTLGWIRTTDGQFFACDPDELIVTIQDVLARPISTAIMGEVTEGGILEGYARQIAYRIRKPI